MNIDQCKSCKYHTRYESGAVHCGYDQNIMCLAAVKDPKTKIDVILTCPKEKYKK